MADRQGQRERNGSVAVPEPRHHGREPDGAATTTIAPPTERQVERGAGDVARHETSVAVRRLGSMAPLAAGYAGFQAVLSSFPTLSYSALHYLLAVVAGVAVGTSVGCALLWSRRAGRVAATPASVPLAPVGASTPLAGGVNILTIGGGTADALRASLIRVEDRELGTLTGWPHFFGEEAAGARPTALSTAYGLKSVLLLGEHDGRIELASLSDTLWRLRLRDGGWSARTQSDVSRPEVSAVVLGALAASGCDLGRLAEAADAFERTIGVDGDPMVRDRVFMLCSAIRCLIRVRPSSPHVAELCGGLLSGAVADPRHHDLICWCDQLAKPGRPALAVSVPSVPHTAHAVVTLARASRVLGVDAAAEAAIEQAVRWLAEVRDLGERTEQIRRFATPRHAESLTYRHFTAAWVAKALLSANAVGAPIDETLLDRAISVVCDSQQHGVWEWSDRQRPVWMTYQGIEVLRERAMLSWSPL
jgi:hypothetical protein